MFYYLLFEYEIFTYVIIFIFIEVEDLNSADSVNQKQVSKTIVTVVYIIGRGPLGQKVAKNAFSWHPSGEHLVCGLFERHIGKLPPKKFPSEKLARY